MSNLVSEAKQQLERLILAAYESAVSDGALPEGAHGSRNDRDPQKSGCTEILPPALPCRRPVL